MVKNLVLHPAAPNRAVSVTREPTKVQRHLRLSVGLDATINFRWRAVSLHAQEVQRRLDRDQASLDMLQLEPAAISSTVELPTAERIRERR